MRHIVIAIGAALAACAGGCGSGSGSAAPPPSSSTAAPLSPYAAARAHVCSTAAETVIARALGVRTGSLRARRTRDSTGASECTFRTHSHGRPVVVSVTVDGSPQPYAVMERAATEEAQLFTARRLTPAPQTVTRLGIGAFWFPAQQHLETTDAVNLITATIVRWPGAAQRRRRDLAAIAARPYLGPLRRTLARGPSPVGG